MDPARDTLRSLILGVLLQYQGLAMNVFLVVNSESGSVDDNLSIRLLCSRMIDGF